MQSVQRFNLEGKHYDLLLEQYRHATVPKNGLEPIHSYAVDWDDDIINTIACNFLSDKNNKELIDSWTPMYNNLKPKLWIGGIFPISKTGRYSCKELVYGNYHNTLYINSNHAIS